MALSDINGRQVPWSCEGLMLQYRGMPGSGRRSWWVNEQGEGVWIGDLGEGRKEEGDNI